MRTKDDLLVGGLYQDINEGGDLIERYYVELSGGIKIFLDRGQLGQFSVPCFPIIPSWDGRLGAIYTTLSTGENYFIAE